MLVVGTMCLRTSVALHSKVLSLVGVHILAVLSLNVVTSPAGATQRARTWVVSWRCAGCDVHTYVLLVATQLRSEAECG